MKELTKNLSEIKKDKFYVLEADEKKIIVDTETEAIAELKKLKEKEDAKISDGSRKLNKLFDSFEGVNAHAESKPLIEAIQLLDKHKTKLAETKLKEFNKICANRTKEIC